MSWVNELIDLYEINSDKIGVIEYRRDMPYVLLPPFHTTVTAQITVTIDQDGNFMNAEPVDSNDKLTIIPVTEKSGSRTAGKEPHPLCDNLRYLAGDYTKYYEDDGICHELYISQLKEWVESEYCHEKVRAIYLYLKKNTLISNLIEKKIIKLNEQNRIDDKENIQGIVQTKAFVRFIIRLPNTDFFEAPPDECWKDKTLQDCYINYVRSQEKEILDAYLRLEERAAGLRTEEKTVRIGSVYPLAPGTIPRMLREFGATFPFIIYNRLTPEIAEGLQKGKYDIGFCSDLLKSDELEYYPIRGSYIAVAVPKGHPLEKRDTVSLKEIAYYPQIMFSKTSGFRKLQEQLLAAEGISVKPVCAAEEIEVVAGLVENGFGIAVLPYMDIVRLHNIATIPVETSLWKSKFYIARRKYGIRSEQEDAFFQYWRN